MMIHYICKCSVCDKIIRQCRCDDANKTVKYEVCSKCQEEG